MGTRAIYVFTDNTETFQVYKHWDGYPSQANKFIKASLKFAWELPRFEASDFGAAFIVANKQEQGGDVRLTENTPIDHIDSDIDFIYVTFIKNDQLHLKAYDNRFKSSKGLITIFDAPFVEFEAFAEKGEA